mgnify:CR=1 FL=1
MKKAADFINFCDAFSIPVLSLTNVTGFEATLEAEKDMARAVAKLTYAFANASVPKVNVIVGKSLRKRIYCDEQQIYRGRSGIRMADS